MMFEERCADALKKAIEALQEKDPETTMILRDILAQKGCEDLDDGCSDGKLTTLMDLIIWG